MESTHPKKAIVTGGAGFLGSHLCEQLLAEGFHVVALDNFITGTASNVAHLNTNRRFQLTHDDICTVDLTDTAADYVLHFASPASPSDYLKHPIQTLQTGSLGTLNALEMARRSNARFLLASTSETYGDPLVYPQHEEYWGNVNPIGPRSVYDEAKRFAEAATMAYRRTHGTNTGIVRLFNTHGPRMRGNDGRAVPTFICQALNCEPITVAGEGFQTRSLQYVDDAVDGCLRMLTTDEPGPINIGNPAEVTIINLADRIRNLLGSASPIEHVPRPVDDPSVRRPDITLAQQLLGWEPKIDIDDGLKRTAEWFTHNR